MMKIKRTLSIIKIDRDMIHGKAPEISKILEGQGQIIGERSQEIVGVSLSLSPFPAQEIGLFHGQGIKVRSFDQ